MVKGSDKKTVEGAEGIKKFIKGEAEIMYLNYRVAREEYEVMRHYRALTAYINDPKGTVGGLPRGRILVFELTLHPEKVDVEVARRWFGYGKGTGDGEVRRRVSLIAKLYTIGSRLGGEKHEAVRLIEEGHRSRKEEIKFHRGCERYYAASALQKRHRELLRAFSEGSEPLDELERKASVLDSGLKRMEIESTRMPG